MKWTILSTERNFRQVGLVFGMFRAVRFFWDAFWRFPMVRTLILLACGTLSVVGILWASPEESPDGDKWKAVREAMEKQLPQTAIQELEPIIKAALAAKNYPEACRAVAWKISLEGTIQGDKPEERITRLQATMKDLPEEMKPVMETILAHWYWQFFQMNRWRFMQRTATDQPPGEDINSWDLKRILAEIDLHFTAAIAQEDLLRKIPVESFDALLTKGTMPDAARPTLYDVLVHEALSFYTAAEQAGNQVQNAFVLQADSPVFGTTAESWRGTSSHPTRLRRRSRRCVCSRNSSPFISRMPIPRRVPMRNWIDWCLATARPWEKPRATVTKRRCNALCRTTARNPFRLGPANCGDRCCAASDNWSRRDRWLCPVGRNFRKAQEANSVTT
jgi:hypothetical protein